MNDHHTHILHGRHARTSIASAITNTRTHLHLLAYAISPAPTYDSTLQPSIFRLLCDQPRRGIECQAIIASHAQHSPHEAANTLAADELKGNGWTVLRYPVKPVMHAKLLILDRRKIIMGSHNLTSAALEHNRELSIMTEHPNAVSDAFDFFTKLHDACATNGKNIRTG